MTATHLQFGPVIPSASARYVHHIAVFLCSNLNHTHVGASSECKNAHIDIGLCFGGGTIIAAWAVGGEVSWLVYGCDNNNLSFFHLILGFCVPK